MEQTPSDGHEERFAENLRVVLRERGMSQEALAKEMSDRGYQFHQATIYKILTGKRKVGLGEASEIASILDVPLDLLLAGGSAAVTRTRALRAVQQMVLVKDELFEAWKHWSDAYLEMAAALGVEVGDDGTFSSEIGAEASAVLSADEVDLATRLLNETDEDLLDPTNILLLPDGTSRVVNELRERRRGEHQEAP